MLHARGQSTAVLQQQHVDRLHRHTIHTTSAGMAHANGPAARCHFSTCSFFFRSYNEVFVQTAFIPYYLSTDIDFACVLCTSSPTTAAVASLSFPLSLSVFVQGYLTQQYRHFSTYPFIFRSYNGVFVQTAFIPYFPSGTYYFSICGHGRA